MPKVALAAISIVMLASCGRHKTSDSLENTQKVAGIVAAFSAEHSDIDQYYRALMSQNSHVESQATAKMKALIEHLPERPFEAVGSVVSVQDMTVSVSWTVVQPDRSKLMAFPPLEGSMMGSPISGPDGKSEDYSLRYAVLEPSSPLLRLVGGTPVRIVGVANLAFSKQQHQPYESWRRRLPLRIKVTEAKIVLQ